jgi:Zn-dependent membrane protease YugP
MAAVIIVIAIVAVLYGPAWWARFVLDRCNRYDYFSGNGFDLAHLLLERHNLGDVSVIETDKGSHYDPEKKGSGPHRDTMWAKNPNRCGCGGP